MALSGVQFTKAKQACLGTKYKKNKKYALRIPTVVPESCLIKSKIWKFREDDQFNRYYIEIR